MSPMPKIDDRRLRRLLKLLERPRTMEFLEKELRCCTKTVYNYLDLVNTKTGSLVFRRKVNGESRYLLVHPTE